MVFCASARAAPASLRNAPGPGGDAADRASGGERFHAPSTGAYDDLISATLMCAWWGERGQGGEAFTIPLRF